MARPTSGGPAGIAGSVGLEDPVSRLGWYARAVIGDGDLDEPTRVAGSDADGTARWRVAHGVLEEVGDHLLEERVVDVDER